VDGGCEVLVLEDGGDDGGWIVFGFGGDGFQGVAVAEVDVAGLAVLEVAEEDGERGQGLGDVAFQLDGLLSVDSLACRLFELEVAWVCEAQLGVVGECRLEVGDGVNENGALAESAP
jgi:hypothetical protein